MKGLTKFSALVCLASKTDSHSWHERVNKDLCTCSMSVQSVCVGVQVCVWHNMHHVPGL